MIELFNAALMLNQNIMRGLRESPDVVRRGLLVRHRDRMLTTEELLEHCWDGRRDPFSNPLHTQITRLRKIFKGALRIASVRGAGYRVELDVGPPASIPSRPPLG